MGKILKVSSLVLMLLLIIMEIILITNDEGFGIKMLIVFSILTYLRCLFNEWFINSKKYETTWRKHLFKFLLYGVYLFGVFKAFGAVALVNFFILGLLTPVLIALSISIKSYIANETLINQYYISRILKMF